MPRTFTWIDPMPFVCPTTQACRVLDDQGRILFFDGSHVTQAGARDLARRLAVAGELDFLRAPAPR